MQYHSNTVEPSTLDALILSCVEPINRMAYKYCGNFSNHEDFVSIGMLRVCEVAARVQVHTTDPLVYLCEVARNAMIDEYHRLHRFAVVSLDAPFGGSDGFCLADLIPDRSDVPAPALADELRQALQSALERLSAHQRTAVQLRAGLPGYGVHNLEETARALHTSSRNAAQMADYHGRRNLARDARLCAVVGVEVAQ